jgi:deoxyribonuclease II
VPNYPPFVQDGYEYPSDETTNGQSFLCISVDATNFATIINSWQYVYPNWYDVYEPDSVVDVYTNLSMVFGGYHVKTEPWTNVATVKTLSGKAIEYISKYSNWGLDFYEDLVAPTLNVGLRTETWQEGSGNMPSFCSEADGGDGEYAYTVLNIESIDLGSGIAFTETKDHSKWAVSMDKNYPWVCVGDINRQTGQESRAGGTLCMSQTAVWDAYNGSIASVMPC